MRAAIAGASLVLFAYHPAALAQATDVNVDRALVNVDITSPYAVEKLLTREHAARRLHEELHQLELCRPELDLAARPPHPVGLAIEIDVASR